MKTCSKCKLPKNLSEFTKDSRSKDGLYSQCKLCRKHFREANKDRISKSKRVYQRLHKEEHVARNQKYHRKEGYGVYKAIYPSGIYIGSGEIVGRRNHHLNGSDHRAKLLNERAFKVETVLLCEHKDCVFYEQLVIDYYGIENLLNSRKSLA